jgi:hypothetical protein
MPSLLFVVVVLAAEKDTGNLLRWFLSPEPKRRHSISLGWSQ